MVIKHICISCSQSLLRGIKMKNSCTSYLFLSVCKLTNNKLLVHSPQIVYRRTEIDLMLGAAPFCTQCINWKYHSSQRGAQFNCNSNNDSFQIVHFEGISTSFQWYLLKIMKSPYFWQFINNNHNLVFWHLTTFQLHVSVKRTRD